MEYNIRLIIGLGNPGKKYEKTRHNLGFLVIEALVEKLQAAPLRLENKFQTKLVEVRMGSRLNSLHPYDQDVVMLAEPQTFMNNSGKSISALRSYYKIDTEDIWVVADEIDLELGKIRVRLGGSSAGHRGMQSIIDHLGTGQFWRIRLGIGRPPRGKDPEEYVLEKFRGKEKKTAEEMIDRSAGLLVESLKNEIKEESVRV